MPIIITHRFKKAYQKLPPEIQKKVKKALRLLDENRHHPSLRIRKIQGVENIYEGRVDRKYRFSFQRESDDVILHNVYNHDECLKNP